MTKVSKIKDYIARHKPTRKELVRHIIVDLNKKCSNKEFDSKFNSCYHGYYSTNFTKWYRAGNVIMKNNRLYLTAQGKRKDISLYQKPLEAKYKEMMKQLYYLRSENIRLSNKLWDFNEIIKKITDLAE